MDGTATIITGSALAKHSRNAAKLWPKQWRLWHTTWHLHCGSQSDDAAMDVTSVKCRDDGRDG